MSEFEEKLKSLAKISFEGRGESFVEQKFIAPLLELLGYDSHKDYEVILHGDDGSSFKLKCPPVEKGNKKVRNYYPDYIPTIRKKTFWIIEAKSPKSGEISKKESVAQGLQYCLHPEIQAKYLFLSDGELSKIFDIQKNYFLDLDGDIYEPILTFRNTEIQGKWDDIYKLLSPEKIRDKLEQDLIILYDKICLSSLDESYPKRVSAKISSRANGIKSKIQKNLNTLRCKSIDQGIEDWRDILKNASDSDLLFYMEYPLRLGGVEAVPSVRYVRKHLEQQMSVKDILKRLTEGYEKQSIFRKQNTFAGLCELHNRISDEVGKQEIKKFLFDECNLKMNAFNKTEAAVLRVMKKVCMISLYDRFNKRIEEVKQNLPEIIRFVDPPTVIQKIYPVVLNSHQNILPSLRKSTEDSCGKLTQIIEGLEATIKQDWENVIQGIPNGQREIGGFEYCGLGENVDRLEAIVRNFNVAN